MATPIEPYAILTALRAAILAANPEARRADAVMLPLASAFEHLLRHPDDHTFRKAVITELHDAGDSLTTAVSGPSLARACQSGPRLLPPPIATTTSESRRLMIVAFTEYWRDPDAKTATPATRPVVLPEELSASQGLAAVLEVLDVMAKKGARSPKQVSAVWLLASFGVALRHQAPRGPHPQEIWGSALSTLADGQHRAAADSLAEAMLAEAARTRDIVGARLAWHFFSEACLRCGRPLESLVFWAIATHYAEPEFRQGFVHELCARTARQQARIARSLGHPSLAASAIETCGTCSRGTARSAA